MLHILQRDILLKLSRGEDKSLKFSELKPADIENDLFNYHLKYLVKQGDVSKETDGYKITNKGVQSLLLIDSHGFTYDSFRVSVIVYVIDRRSDPMQILIQKKHRKPYLGEINPGISGKIKQGEDIQTAAQRKLLEETGLLGKCIPVGVIRKTRHVEESELIDDGFFFVCVCEEFSGELIPENKFGENYWTDADKALNIQRSNEASGEQSRKVFERIVAGDYSPFLFEEKIFLKNL